MSKVLEEKRKEVWSTEKQMRHGLDKKYHSKFQEEKI